jgi:hypothetical protein
MWCAILALPESAKTHLQSETQQTFAFSAGLSPVAEVGGPGR